MLGPDELFYIRDGDQYFEWSPDSRWLFAQYAPSMSNRETVPEVMIKNMPGKIDKGIDQQLEKAVEELLKIVVN